MFLGGEKKKWTRMHWLWDDQPKTILTYHIHFQILYSFSNFMSIFIFKFNLYSFLA